MSKVLSASATLESDLADTAVFNCSEMIPTKFLRHYPEYVNRNLNVSELARVCGVSRPTVYKYLKLLQNGIQR